MSEIERVQRRRRDGTPYAVYRVRWTDENGRRRSQTVKDPKAAQALAGKLELLRYQGELGAIDRGRRTLRDYVAEWWESYATPNLETWTLESYRVMWNAHLLPRLGDTPLRQITPPRVRELRRELERAGVGRHSVRRAMAVLQSILARAVEDGELTANPVAVVKKPSSRRNRTPIALSPAEVEELRSHLPRARDRMLVALMAYSGPRPQDALALRWEKVERDQIRYDVKNIDGKIVPGAKTGDVKWRRCLLLPELAKDLAEYRLAQPPGIGFVIARADGGPWRSYDYRNWHRRPQNGELAPGVKRRAAGPFTRAALAIGRPDLVPYDLRHTFASLLFRDGTHSNAEIAAMLGHRVDTLLRVYVHVIEGLRGAERLPANDQIRIAREQRRRAA